MIIKLIALMEELKAQLFFQVKKKNRKIAFYDKQWNKLNYNDTYPIFEYDIPKPKKLDLLIEICEKASKGFAFVRIDSYILNDDSIKLGELTFTPTSGQIVLLQKNKLIFLEI